MYPKILLFALVFFCGMMNVNAQISYEYSDFLEAGDEFRLSTTGGGGIDFAQTGEDFIWDYAELNFTGQENNIWIDAGDGGYEFSWCLTNGIFFGCASEFADFVNIAQLDSDGLELMGFGLTDLVTHYKKEGNVFETRMTGASVDIEGVPITLPLLTEYSDPDTVYQFPLQLGVSDNSSSEYTLDFSDFGFAFSLNVQTQRTNTVEGYGFLTTPYGDFEDVLKMKTIIITENTIMFDETVIPTIDTAVEYKWFDKAYGIPVLTARGNISFLGENILNVVYIDSIRCVNPQPIAFATPQEIFADENTQEADVTFVNLSQNADNYTWDFGDGSISTQEDPSHTYNCPGEYEVTLIVSNSACNGDPEGADTLNISLVVQDTSNFQILEIDFGLESNIAGAEYQWLDCTDGLSPIDGATDQAFYPTTTGEYALAITRNDCETIISDCYVVIISDVDDIDEENPIRVYPNPTKKDLLVDLGRISENVLLEVFDLRGRLILTQYTEGMNITRLFLDAENGIYFLRVQSEYEVFGIKRFTLLK
jgi:hypothetical protein